MVEGGEEVGVEDDREDRRRGALDLEPGVVRFVEDRGAPPALDRAAAGDPDGQLDYDEPDAIVHEGVAEGAEGEVRVGAVGQGIKERFGDADVVEERVAALAGEDLDAVSQVKDLAHRRVGRRDDGAGGGAAGGVRAGELRHLHVLGAGGVGRGEGEAPGDVLDEIIVEVELELVEGSGIPRGADLRRGIHRDDRARAVVVAGPGEAVDVGDVLVLRCPVEVVRHAAPS